MRELACVNGRLTDLNDAVVSIHDRGIQFGDGVYEVIRSYGGRLWAFDRHMSRFANSLEAIWIRNITVDEVASVVRDTFAASGIPDALVYISVTRGTAPRDYAVDPSLKPTLIVTVRVLHDEDPINASAGVKAITHADIRWARVDVKSLNLLGNMIAKKIADDAGVFEALLHRDNVMTEGAGTSLFISAGGRIMTRERGPHLLPGVTRELVIECASEAGFDLREEPYSLDDLMHADEVFITGTTFGVYGVIEVDGRPIADGNPEPVALELANRYQQRVRDGRDGL